MSEGTPKWLRAGQAARRLGMSRADLYRLIDAGQLPAYRIGRLIRLLEADVEAYRLRHPGDDAR
jgi:excisionase family DNA binding protein